VWLHGLCLVYGFFAVNVVVVSPCCIYACISSWYTSLWAMYFATVSALFFYLFFNCTSWNQTIKITYQTDLHQIFSINRNMTVDEWSHFRFPIVQVKGHCNGNQFIGMKWQNCHTSPAFIAVAFGNGLEDCTADVWINSGDASTYCRYMARFCWVTPEFMRLEYVQHGSVGTLVGATLLG